jgi:hypothetical protein
MGGRTGVGWSRVVGERDTWWEDMRRLLAGKPIRRSPPESQAIERARAALGEAGDTVDPVAFALSHDGSGRRRGVTAIAFHRQHWDGGRTPGASQPSSGRHAMAARRDAADRACLASLPVRSRFEPGLLGRMLRRLPSQLWRRG